MTSLETLLSIVSGLIFYSGLYWYWSESNKLSRYIDV